MKQREEIISAKQIRIKTLKGLLFAGVFIAACYGGWQWLKDAPKEQGAQKPYRAALKMNEAIFSKTLDDGQLAKTYPVSKAAKKVRVNGLIGLRQDIDSNWRLEIIRQEGDTLRLSMDDIRLLPKTEIIFDFKCIEGWSQVSYWGGVKFSDLVKRYGLDAQMRLSYTGLETPDKQYYVGIDNKSMMHPQTILAYEMNGSALPQRNGAPLRLIIPVKYGVKHLKRIGRMYFSNTPPPDYWHERGYDYFCGL